MQRDRETDRRLSPKHGNWYSPHDSHLHPNPHDPCSPHKTRPNLLLLALCHLFAFTLKPLSAGYLDKLISCCSSIIMQSLSWQGVSSCWNNYVISAKAALEGGRSGDSLAVLQFSGPLMIFLCTITSSGSLVYYDTLPPSELSPPCLFSGDIPNNMIILKTLLFLFGYPKHWNRLLYPLHSCSLDLIRPHLPLLPSSTHHFPTSRVHLSFPACSFVPFTPVALTRWHTCCLENISQDSWLRGIPSPGQWGRLSLQDEFPFTFG